MQKSGLVGVSSVQLFVFVCFVSLMATPQDAHAYLDPGTGSMILQILVAGLLGAVFVVKTFFGRIKAFFARILRGKSTKNKD